MAGRVGQRLPNRFVHYRIEIFWLRFVQSVRFHMQVNRLFYLYIQLPFHMVQISIFQSLEMNIDKNLDELIVVVVVNLRFIALFSLERLIAVKYPIKRYKLINLEREKRTITCFVLFSFFFFAHSIAITHVEINPESRLSFCTTHDEWYELANVMSKVVAVVSIILPLMLIVFSNVTIAYELFRSKKLVVKIYNRKKIRPLRSWSRSRSNQTVEVNLETLNSSTVTLQQRRKSQSEPTALDGLNKKLLNHSEIYSSHNRSRSGMRRLTLFEIELISYSQELNRSRKYSKTTKTLLTISVTYIMLNFLMCMSKLKRLTLVSRDNQIETLRYNESYSDIDEFSPIMDFYKLDVSSADSNTEEINLKIIDLLTCFTYYLNYSINFFLYVVNLTEFKKMLKKIVKLN